MKSPIPILTAALLLVAAPALAGERPGPGGCGGGCGGGHGGGYSVNVNVNASASASATAWSGAALNARAYDVRAIGARGAAYGGVISTGGDYAPGYGYIGHGLGPVVIGGPGYGPSRPHGYVVYGFGRRYVTTDRCGACGYGPPPPPCHDVCHGHGHDRSYDARGHGRAKTYARSATVAESYSVRESYSEHAAWSEGYERHTGGAHERVRPDRLYREEGPRYVPIPYQAGPLEPVPYERAETWPPAHYAPPPVLYSEPAPAPYYPEPPVPSPEPLGYYGDLPPGDSGEGMPYRQESGERG